VKTADKCSHRRARDADYFVTPVTQFVEDTDVGVSARSATAERDRDPFGHRAIFPSYGGL
jgi:hypothetical protein